MKNFLKKQDLIWKKLPTAWNEGAFSGNGRLGSLVYFDKKNNALYMEICSGEVVDHRENQTGDITYDRARLPIGHFLIIPSEKIKSCDLRLDLFNGELKGSFSTELEEVKIKSFVCAKEDIIYFKYNAKKEKITCRFVPAKAESPRQTYGKIHNDFRFRKDYIENDEPVLIKEGNKEFFVQKLKFGGETVTAAEKIKNELFITVCHTFPEENALEKAKNILSRKENIYKKHKEFWNNFYGRSLLSLSDGKLENFYYVQLYKIASATMNNGMLIDCCGPWLSKETPWPLIWWNLNVQLTYMSVSQANYPELMNSLIFALEKNIESLKENVPEKYRKNNAMTLPRITDFQLRGDAIAPFKGEEGKTYSCNIEVGNLIWVMQIVYNYCSLTNDKKTLDNVVLPILKGSVEYILNFVYEKNNEYHLMVTSSPEYEEAGEDCTYNLSLLKWGLKTLAKIDTDKKWLKISEKLAPLPYDEKEGFLIAKNVHYTHSHRHFSHLLCAYPLFLETEREKIIKTINHWHKYKEGLQGYSFTGTALLYEQLKMGNEAYESFLKLFGKYLKPNTMYEENGPVIETPLSGMQVISEMALQNHNGIIKLFPAMPDKIKDFTFDNLRCENASLVGGVYKNNRTMFAKITSLFGGSYKLCVDFKNNFYIEQTEKIRVSKETKVINVKLKKGETVYLYEKTKYKKIKPVTSKESNFFGIK